MADRVVERALVLFPHANGFACADRRFIAHWIVWFDVFGPSGADPLTEAMPRYALHEGLAAQLRAGREFSVDVLARILVPPPYRNTGQASEEFVQANASLVEPAEAIGQRTGRPVKGLRLTDHARTIWKALGPDDAGKETGEARKETLRAFAILESDSELDGDSAATGPDAQGEAPATPLVSGTDNPDRASIVHELVCRIHADPFQPHFRLRPAGRAITGWPARLQSYFWPIPTQGYLETVSQTSSMSERAAGLAAAIQEGRHWSETETAASIQLADDIFSWGGVPQSLVTTEKVRAVFENAIAGEVVDASAPMNSGWTKLAAFASAHLEPIGGAQVIWDSRVSTSVIGRLDLLLADKGFAEPRVLFPDIGLIPGRGGFRAERQDALRLSWPSGYGLWRTQLAASRLIREMRDVLNAHPDRFGPMPAGVGNGARAWTSRGVEMVLFMDGY